MAGCALSAALLAGCGASTGSTSGGVATYNVELKQVGPDIADRCNPGDRLRSIQTARKPELIPAGELSEPRYRVYAFPCPGSTEDVIYDIPVSKVVRMTEVSDPLSPPKPVDSLLTPQGCCRDRNGIWIFDKFEFRLAFHYRGTSDSIFYASATGGTMYRSSTFGTGRGGSTFFGGVELAGLWNASWLDPQHRLQLGVMLGIWPVDGSLFIPLAFHPRYTFKQHPEAYSTNCNSWYVFGDLGIPLDFQTGAALIGNTFAHQRFLIGVGVGYDWAWGCNKDFSIDAGLRRINLPLPEIECCPGIPSADRYPYRRSDALFVRLGITF